MQRLQQINPGSKEAIAKGCTCSVMDNAHGQGFILNGQRVFWYSEGCPVHDK